MRSPRKRHLRLRPWTRAALFAMVLVLPGCRTEAGAPPAPEFGDSFWKVWGDGRAELAGYDLSYPRYGKIRRGSAVAIFVTETFSGTHRVKADPGRHPKSDEYPVMKLNLVQDFPTGIYDYNLMTSVFVQLASANGLPAGSPTKVSFSSQEWCGQVWGQILFDAGAGRLVSHSYFDGEADHQERLAIPVGAVAEDALLLWARGLASPLLGPGETRQVPLVRSLVTARLQHVPVVVETAKLTHEAGTQRIRVPAGEFEVSTRRAAVLGGATWTFHVETASPGRVISWECSDGTRAELLGAERLSYWRMNGPGFESELARLGLMPRKPRMP